jgi:hypothetical protein
VGLPLALPPLRLAAWWISEFGPAQPATCVLPLLGPVDTLQPPAHHARLHESPQRMAGLGSNFGSNLSEPELIREHRTPIKPGYSASPEPQRSVRAQYRPLKETTGNQRFPAFWGRRFGGRLQNEGNNRGTFLSSPACRAASRSREARSVALPGRRRVRQPCLFSRRPSRRASAPATDRPTHQRRRSRPQRAPQGRRERSSDSGRPMWR